MIINRAHRVACRIFHERKGIVAKRFHATTIYWKQLKFLIKKYQNINLVASISLYRSLFCPFTLFSCVNVYRFHKAEKETQIWESYKKRKWTKTESNICSVYNCLYMVLHTAYCFIRTFAKNTHTHKHKYLKRKGERAKASTPMYTTTWQRLSGKFFTFLFTVKITPSTTTMTHTQTGSLSSSIARSRSQLTIRYCSLLATLFIVDFIFCTKIRMLSNNRLWNCVCVCRFKSIFGECILRCLLNLKKLVVLFLLLELK